MRAMVVVEVLPLLELQREHLGVVDDHTVEHPIELLGVDPVRALDLAVQPRRRRPDVDVLDPTVEDMPVELGLELRAVVGLDPPDVERELLQDVVDELDRALPAEPVVDPQDSEAGCSR